MNMGVAILIANPVGKFFDIEMDEAGCSQGATLRIHIGIVVNTPLKRAIPLLSSMGDKLLVHLTHDRLPNFCFLCGRLRYIDKYYALQFEESFTDPGALPSGLWLRAVAPVRSRAKVISGMVLPVSH
ncbi:UNVERIFIED_CONTAM: hypothetical protein Slati_4159200 [Sesamum latifolium]|uniref:Zinc knuckle CX2CX4HX4C domain-containing protein n=1 Tax=Sesamum latifolium TaxID=2727402 RepID=A0AAW2T935_9LAMI